MTMAVALRRCGWTGRRADGVQRRRVHAAICTETFSPSGANTDTDFAHRLLPEPHAAGGRGGVDVRGESLRQGSRCPARQALPRPSAVRAVFLLAWRCSAGEPRGVTM